MMKKFFTLLAFVAISLSSVAQWLPQASGFTQVSRGIKFMHAVTDQVVWATAYDGSGGGAYIQEFTRTVNGGDLWTPGIINNTAGLEPGMIFATDGNTAYVPMYKQTGALPQGIYATTNGGTTWTRQTTAAFSNAASFPNCVHFFDANNGWCQGDPINGDFEMYTTTNGGTTWTLVPAANIPAPLSGEWGVVGYYSAVGDNIWFGTNKSRVYRSADRGLTWEVSVTSLPVTYVDVEFASAMHGIAMDKGQNSTGAMSETLDGGITWATISATGPVLTNDYAYVPGTPNTWVSTGAAEGATGISYSYDGGHTWAFFPDTEGTQFLATDWINSTTGWCGAFNESNTVGGMYKFNGSLEEPLPPTNLQGTVTGGNDVHLTWDAPGGGGSGTTEELIYDNDGTSTGAYSYEGFTMSTHMSPQGPCQILTLKYFTTVDAGDNTFNAEVYGWDDGAGTPGTTQLFTTSATAIDQDWLEVDVTGENLMVDGDFVVGFGSINATTYLGYDENLNNGRSWDFDPSTSSWASWTEAYLIRAVVQYTDGTIREISAAPSSDAPKMAADFAKSAKTQVTVNQTQNPRPAQTRGERELLGYNVYRNGAMIAGQITDTFYDDMDLANGGYQYLVTAVYDNGESTAAGPVEIEITGGGNQTSIILDFEEQADFDLTFTPWEAVDLDGGATYGFTGITFPHSGEPMAYIAFNPLTTEPAVTGMTPHGGERLGACFASVPPAVNNDWMISPQVTLGEYPMLSMWVKSYTAEYGLETYNVLVSTTDNNPTSFTKIAGPIEAPATAWTYVEYDLTEFQGEDVYVAIQCVSNDKFIFLIDDVAVSFITSSNNQPVNNLKVYPNPVSDVLNVISGSEITKASLYNISGQLVYQSNDNSNELRISTGEMPSGLYMLSITTKEGTSVRKVSIR